MNKKTKNNLGLIALASVCIIGGSLFSTNLSVNSLYGDIQSNNYTITLNNSNPLTADEAGTASNPKPVNTAVYRNTNQGTSIMFRIGGELDLLSSNGDFFIARSKRGFFCNETPINGIKKISIKCTAARKIRFDFSRTTILNSYQYDSEVIPEYINYHTEELTGSTQYVITPPSDDFYKFFRFSPADDGNNWVNSINIEYSCIEESNHVLKSIEVDESSKTEYGLNDEFVAPKIIGHYYDGENSDVTNECTFTGFDSSTTGEKTVTVTCNNGRKDLTTSYKVNIAAAQTKLKFAIFADVQLTGNSAIKGESVINAGTTANAPLALKQHLQFCKDNDIETILMNGDITNQANEYYYNFFESIVSSVYGSNKNAWPEFVWNMGNHEWWDGVGETESSTKDCVALFKQYARIDSDNLKAQSSVKHGSFESTLPSYYKVINGVPIMVISGINSAGEISTALYNEINGWLTNIKKLPSVQAGGPIFVEYHYPLSTSMTHGQGASAKCKKIETLFADTPNAVIFTGDTHFPGVNERAINQVNFTTINLGTSSYSRMVNQSAVICDSYDNVSGGTGKQGDKLEGQAKFKEAYTPTIQIVDVLEDNTFKINRYMTGDPSVRQAGPEWSFDPILSKSDFKYTNERFQNTDAALELYGARGLSWDAGDAVTFGVDEVTQQMTVRFKDVAQHHFVEHYQIKVNGKVYDEVSSYYKYLPNRQDNYFILEDITLADNYTVEVTAYDFFDNPSLNKLTSTTNEQSKTVDGIDNQMTKTYSDIQTQLRFDDVSTDSKSSVEYYYKGIDTYKYGAILNRILSNKDETVVDCADFISTDYGTREVPLVKFDVKNLSSNDLVVGLTVVDMKGTWKTDFGVEHQVTVTGNQWTTVSWNLYDLFGISSLADLDRLQIKAKLSGASSSGYEMNFLIDNVEVIPTKKTVTRNLRDFEKSTTYDLPEDIPLTGTLTIDFAIQDPTTHARFILGDGWNDYFGYYNVFCDHLGSTYPGVTLTSTDDGFVRVIFDLENLSPGQGSPQKINLIFFDKNYCDAVGKYEINPEAGEQCETVMSYKALKVGKANDSQINFATKPSFATGVVNVDVKLNDPNGYINFMIGNWSNYVGYFQVFNDPTECTFNRSGITTQLLADGFTRYTFKLNEVTKINHVNNQTPIEIDYQFVYARGDWNTTDGWIRVSISSY